MVIANVFVPMGNRTELKQELEKRIAEDALKSKAASYELDKLSLTDDEANFLKGLENALQTHQEMVLLSEIVNDKGGTLGDINTIEPPLNVAGFVASMSSILKKFQNADSQETEADDPNPAGNNEPNEGDSEDPITARKRGEALSATEQVLRESERPLFPGEIFEAVKKRLGVEIPKSTITNNLSRLVNRDKKVRKTEIPEQQTSTYEWIPFEKSDTSHEEVHVFFGNHEDEDGDLPF